MIRSGPSCAAWITLAEEARAGDGLREWAATSGHAALVGMFDALCGPAGPRDVFGELEAQRQRLAPSEVDGFAQRLCARAAAAARRARRGGR